MAISLSKGGNVNLSKEAPGLNKIIVGLGWDARATDGAAFDLDASAFLVKMDGKVRSDSDFIFTTNQNQRVVQLNTQATIKQARAKAMTKRLKSL